MVKKIDFLVTILVTAFVFYRIFSSEFFISPDSIRYVDSGLNLLYHNVYSYNTFKQHIPPPPSLGFGGFFTAVELAVASVVDQDTEMSLICISREGQALAHQNCDLNLLGLRALYSIELLLFLLMMRMITSKLFTSRSLVTIATLVPLMFNDIFNFASSILTEPSYLCVVSILLYSQIMAFKQPKTNFRWLLLGFALGVLCHIKPIWLLMICFYSCMFGMAAFFKKSRSFLTTWLWFSIGMGFFILPMLMRNYVQLDVVAFSDRTYLIAALSHRVGYNMMSYNEWLIGWVYFLPDFGDQLANYYSNFNLNEKLAWGNGSFYQIGRDIIHTNVLNNVKEQYQLNYLIQNHVLEDLKKHFATTLLLSWRGIFISGSLSLLAILLVPLFAKVVSKRELFETCKVAAPLLMIVFGNALISVSIDRYNIGLLVIYTIVLAVLLDKLAHKIASKLYYG